MKVVAYSIKSFEKEFLAKANQKKHDITLISNPLNLETAAYAEGKDAVIVFTNDDVSAPVVNKLADFGVKYIATRSAGTDHIDKEQAGERKIKVANVPAYSPQAIAEHTAALALALGTPHQAFLTTKALQQIADQTIKNLDLWQENKCVGKACACAKNCRASAVDENVTV
jgi:lactate dehydrogenase-like 2-hydroxyacid dehydrogenase